MRLCPHSIYLTLSLLLLTCFILAAHGQFPRRRRPHRPPPSDEYHHASLTHLKVTSIRGRGPNTPPNRPPYIRDRHSGPRPLHRRQHPYGTNRRPYEPVPRPNRPYPYPPIRPQPPYALPPPLRGNRIYPLPPPLPAPYTTNRASQRCNRYQQCPSGKTFDYSKCECICIVQVTTCPGRQNFNAQTCKCECSSPPVCNQHQRRNDVQCRCDPVYNNPRRGYRPITTVTQSTCPATARYLCSSGQILNPRTCRCECPRFSSTRCIRSQIFDQRTCQCACRRRPGSCPYRQILNRNTCQCECPRGYLCRFPARLDPNTCTCH